MLEPSSAERARTIIEHADRGTLATLTSDFLPFATTVPILTDGQGNAVTVLTNLVPHVGNAWREPRAGLTVAGRLSLQGRLTEVPGIEQMDLQDRYLAVHPDATRHVESLDCSWLRLDTTNVWFDDAWIEIEDFRNAEPDPLAPQASELLAELADVAEPDLVLLCQAIGGRLRTTAAELAGIDRYGLDVIVTEPRGRSRARVPFTEQVDDPRQVISTIGFMVRFARDRAAASAAL